MRFKKYLIEKLSSDIPRKIADNYKRYIEIMNSQPDKYDESPDYLNKVLMKAVSDSDKRFQGDLKSIVPVIATSLREKGADGNNFLKFIAQFPDERVLAQNPDKLSYINQLYINNYTNLNSNGTIKSNGRNVPYIYLNPSLYAKSDEDFKYIANAFALLSDDGYVRRKFKDPSTVNLRQFYTRDGQVREKRDIYKIVDDWYYKSGAPAEDENDGGITSDDEPTITLHDMFKAKGLRDKTSQVEYLKALWDKYGERVTGKSYDVIRSNLSDKDKIYDYVIDGSLYSKVFTDTKSDEKIAKDLFKYIVTDIGEQE